MRGFRKTQTQNLWRRIDSGVFYAAVRSPDKGYTVTRSLRTTAASVARGRLPVALAHLRATAGAQEPARGCLTLEDCAARYLKGKADLGLKPKAVRFCRDTVDMVRRVWPEPGFAAQRVAEVDRAKVERVADALRKRYSRRSFNGALWALRGVLRVAVEAGELEGNPALGVRAMKLTLRRLELPSDLEFAGFMDRLAAVPERAEALVFARLLALTGHRPETLRRLRGEDVDFERRLVRWPPVKHESRANEVPMSPELCAVLRELVAARGMGPLLTVQNPRRAFRAASREAGLALRMTSRVFRHLFTTRALEAGISVADVAQMRGDRDGGGMLLRTYVHPRLARLREAAARLPGVLGNQQREFDGGLTVIEQAGG